MGKKKHRFISQAAKLTDSIDSYLQMIDDFRDRRGLKHELWVCLILILIGYLCGKNTMCGIERYLKIRERDLRKILPLYGEQGQGIPSHNTLSRIMEKLSFERLHHVFLLWIDDLTSDIADDRGQICADGKGIRAARPGESETRVPYVLNALLDMKDVIRLYVALRKVGLKTNEIKVLPELLELIELNNKTVTVDAIGTQTKVVSLLGERGANYILPTKGNQESFRQDLESHFRMMVQDGDVIRIGPVEDPKPAHGRIERRTAWLVEADDLITDRQGFESIRYICLIRRERITVRKRKQIKSSIQEVFYFSDFCGDAAEFESVVRNHWICESAHWWIDHHLCEDQCTARKGFAIENLALMRRIVYNIVQLTCKKKGIEPSSYDAFFHSFANVRNVLFRPLLIV